MSINTYDQLPYPSISYVQTHPDRLATLALLMGMTPAPVGRCRVLELGCASGGNLIPMAYELPGSQFVGIDYSERQVTDGCAIVQALGLKNIALEQMDIMDIDASLGQFDYIIAHGIFSWVPEPVQEQLLTICSQNLAPYGVAYVSYNTYPGWRMFGIIRDMMLYHTRELTEPQHRVAQSRALLNFLAESIPAENSIYGSLLHMYVDLLQGELKGANERGDAFLFHDELEEVNEPIYFYQFAERAERHGLQYLGESEFRTMLDSNFGSRVSETLGQMSRDVIELEQYMDFLRNRTLRQTLLCHSELTLSRSLRPEQACQFYLASRTLAEPPASEIHSVQVAKFRGTDGAMLSTDHPLSKEAMLYLTECWPQVVSFDALFSTARARLGERMPIDEDSAETDVEVLSANVLQAFGYSGSLMELHTWAPAITAEIGERPLVSPVARLQALGSDTVTNLRHDRVNLSDLDRYVIGYLDGQHTPEQIVDALISGPLANGDLEINVPEQEIDAGRIRAIVSNSVENSLRWLAKAALLVS